ncbi:uncharacterized protein LOC18011415 [Eutrema salsugineum]|uniref:uncharacterized protein LOC18011415 n=1 Tax=Eutrema salsugineum TaxID=72664 RepID=UPI000CECE3EA|nr:uncharacterized protein LOC18011415 [Eutrema salsugineum]
MQLEPAGKNQAKAVTSVWWDITNCPLPHDVEAGRVGPFIRMELKRLGFSGPTTIYAFGILSQVPPHVLRALSSTGINLRHIPTTRTTHMWFYLHTWDGRNPSSNIMLISLDRLYGRLLEDLSKRHYILGSGHPPDDDTPDELSFVFPSSLFPKLHLPKVSRLLPLG